MELIINARLINKKKGPKFKIAKENIVCYKVVESWYKPNLNTLYNETNNLMYNYSKYYDTYNISDGVFRTFRNYEGAKKTYDYYSINKKLNIIECVIPKGTEYVKDIFNGLPNANQYGSKSIIYNKIIK